MGDSERPPHPLNTVSQASYLSSTSGLDGPTTQMNVSNFSLSSFNNDDDGGGSGSAKRYDRVENPDADDRAMHAMEVGGIDNEARPSSNTPRKIKFKRAKKLRKAASVMYKKQMKNLAVSRFQHWTKAELVDLMISNAIELRNESQIPHESLVELCDALYDGRDMPPKPPGMTLVELVMGNVMARRIQNVWIVYQLDKRIEEEEAESADYINRLQAIENNDDEHIGNLDYLFAQGADDLVADGSIAEDMDLEESSGGGAGLSLRKLSGILMMPSESQDEGESKGADAAAALRPESGDASPKGGAEVKIGEAFEDDSSKLAGSAPVKPGVAVPVPVPVAVGGKKKGSIQSPTTGPKKEKSRRKKASNILDVPWVAPDWEKAKKYADYVQPRKGGKGGCKYDFNETTTGRHCCIGGFGEQFDLWHEGQISEFSIYGSGVTNYFKYIKWCFWLFATLSVLSFPMLLINIYGPNDTNNGLEDLSSTTVGNLAEDVSNATDVRVTIPGCTGYGIYDVECEMNRDTLAAFYSYLDISIVGVMFIAYLWMRYFEKQEEAALDKNTVNASMYTLMVSQFPPEATEQDLAKHFRDLLDSQSAVATVSIAYDNADEIRECKARGDIIRSKVRLVHEHRYHCTHIKLAKSEATAEKLIEKSRAEFFAKMKKLNGELKKKEALLEKYAKLPMRALVGFVTFNRVENRNSVAHMYNGMNVWQWLCYPKKLRFKGKIIRIRDAPEPSTILWENVSYRTRDRFCRRLFTTFLSVLLVVVSVFFILSPEALQIYATDADDDTAASTSRTSCDDSSIEPICTENFRALTDAEQQRLVSADPRLTPCYCDQFTHIEQSEESLCRSYLEETVNKQLLVFFASAVVLLVNFLIERSLRVFANFEKHFTEDSRGKSIFIRLFVLKFINTGCVFLINNDVSTISEVFLIDTRCRSIELDSKWFNSVGTTIILVQLGDIVLSHGDKVLKWLMHRRRLRRAETDRTFTLTQDELNKMQVGPEFEFAFQYAQIMATFFVVMTYSMGIPLLYLLGAANFAFYYFVEKYLFVRLYKIPPHFNSNIGKSATSLIPLAMIIHLGMSIWILSNEELFSNDPSSSASVVDDSVGSGGLRDRITGKHTLPLFIMAVVIAVLRISFVLAKRSYTSFINALFKFCGCFCTRSMAEKHKGTGTKAVVTYTRAVQRNLIKGLSTYNVLQNPRYKEAFAITWTFAVANKHVRAVRLLKSKAEGDKFDHDAELAEELQRAKVKQKSRQGSLNTADAAGRTLTKQNSNHHFMNSFYNQNSINESSSPHGSGVDFASHSSPSAAVTHAFSAEDSAKAEAQLLVDLQHQHGGGTPPLPADRTRDRRASPNSNPSSTPTPTPSPASAPRSSGRSGERDRERDSERDRNRERNRDRDRDRDRERESKDGHGHRHHRDRDRDREHEGGERRERRERKERDRERGGDRSSGGERSGGGERDRDRERERRHRERDRERERRHGEA